MDLAGVGSSCPAEIALAVGCRDAEIFFTKLGENRLDDSLGGELAGAGGGGCNVGIEEKGERKKCARVSNTAQ